MSDELELLAEIRGEIPGPDRDSVADARAAFIAANVEQPGRRAASRKPSWFSARRTLPVFGATGVIAVAALIVVLLTSGPATHEATASYVDRIATIAQRQARQIDSLDTGQYLLTKSDTVASIEIELTQAKLDKITNRLAETSSRSHFERRYFENTPPRRAEADRASEGRRLAESSKRISLDALPTTTIETTRRFSSISWIDARHDSGDGVPPGERVEYGSPLQERAAAVLRANDIPDAAAELKEATIGAKSSRFEDFSWPSDEIRALPADPDLLDDRLRGKPIPFPLVRDERPVDNDEELFHVAIGLLRSPFASPALRAATMRMIGDMQGVVATPNVVDARGRTGLGLALTDVTPEPQLVLNDDDASVLGVNYLIDRPSKLASGGWIVLPFADRARLGVAYEPAIIVDGAPVCRETRPDGEVQERYCPSQIRPAGKP